MDSTFHIIGDSVSGPVAFKPKKVGLDSFLIGFVMKPVAPSQSCIAPVGSMQIQAFGVAPQQIVKQEIISQLCRAYPNPASAYITVIGNGVVEPKLYSIEGVKQSIPITLTTEGYQLDVSLLPDGVYTLCAKDNQQLATSKIVVLH